MAGNALVIDADEKRLDDIMEVEEEHHITATTREHTGLSARHHREATEVSDDSHRHEMPVTEEQPAMDSNEPAPQPPDASQFPEIPPEEATMDGSVALDLENKDFVADIPSIFDKPMLEKTSTQHVVFDENDVGKEIHSSEATALENPELAQDDTDDSSSSASLQEQDPDGATAQEGGADADAAANEEDRQSEARTSSSLSDYISPDEDNGQTTKSAKSKKSVHIRFDEFGMEYEDPAKDFAKEFSMAVFKTDERCGEIFIERLIGSWNRLRRDYQAMQLAMTQLGLGFITARHNEIKQMCKPHVIDVRALIATWPENLQLAVHRYEHMKDSDFKRERRKNWRKCDLLFFVLRMVRMFAAVAISIRKYYIDEQFMKKVFEQKQKTALRASAGGSSTALIVSQQRKLTEMQKSLKASSISVAPPNSCIVNYFQRRMLCLIADGSMPYESKSSGERNSNYDQLITEVTQSDVTEVVKQRDRASNQRPDTPKRNSALDDLMDSLRRAPRYRTKLDAKLIGRFLRTAGSFSMLLPTDKEDECGAHVEFAFYDDGRLIARQGSRVDAFYYVVLGNIEKLKHVQLGNMDVTKSFGLIERGHATNFDDTDSYGVRECHYVARGKLEVLILPKKSYDDIINATGNVLDFLRRSHSGIFDLLPEQIDDTPTYRVIFYKPDAVVCTVTRSMTWVYVVKSGRVKVVRRQSVYASPDSKDSDAVRMDKQLKFAEGLAGVSFPQGVAKQAVSLYERHAERERRAKKRTAAADEADGVDDNLLPPLHEPSRIPEHVLTDLLGHHISKTRNPPKDTGIRLPPLLHSKWEPKKKVSVTSVTKTCVKTSKKIGKLIDFEEFNQLASDSPERGRSQQKKFKDLPTRMAYVVIDSLAEGDIIGLWHLDNDKAKSIHTASASGDERIVLVSEGAELIQISKRHFLQFASNNAMVKVETLLKQFVDEDEAREKLYERQEWEYFKARKLKDFL